MDNMVGTEINSEMGIVQLQVDPGEKPSMICALYIDPGYLDRPTFIKAWVKAYNEVCKKEGLDPDDPNVNFMYVSLDLCDGGIMYKTPEDVSLVDVPCLCGDKTHWLVKWAERNEDGTLKMAGGPDDGC